ncbi:MAG: polymer-forming cytoskeletal protein [Kiloniellales bacterium]|nr:polymer-forming cytoskeletal protein [Kiloniellales bacterium]
MRAQRLLRAVEQRTEARRPARSGASGVTRVGPDLVIRGVVEGGGQIEVQGKVEGQVRCREVNVAEGGRIEGSVMAERVQIGGAVEGPVRATTVEITKTARVVGNITHLNLSVEAGAYLEGRRPWRPRPLGDEKEQFTFAETD